MSFFAGVYARRTGETVPDTLCDALQRALSRNPDELIQRFRDDRCFLVKADIGAFADRALRIESDAVTFMTGEPLLRSNAPTTNPRSADLVEIHDGLVRNDWTPLERARGVFSLAHYRRQDGTLTLTTDKLGIRPVFYWLGEQFVVFASALRILEQINDVPKVMDMRGVAEINAFGFPLGDRTAFASINLLMPAEVVEVKGASSSRRPYWRWEGIEQSDRPIDALARESFDAFKTAVAIRTYGDRTTAAFLSGGLDSRAILTALHELNVTAHTFNFSLNGTQDQVFSAKFAQSVGAIHTEVPRKRARPLWTMLLANALRALPAGSLADAERPRVVWSGDGGSVVLGHVYLNADLIATARHETADRLVDAVERSWASYVPAWLLQPGVADRVRAAVRRGIGEEIARQQCGDPGRCLHLFLLANDQRRHLAEHFETMDQHRLEFQLPFFDSDFVASVLRVPVDERLGHKFYMRVVRHFSPVFSSVPWQTYPGHESCPLPIPADIRYQWGEVQRRAVRHADKQSLVQQANEMLSAPEFPHSIMRKYSLRLAAALHRYGVRDLGYAIGLAETYWRYWTKCHGHYLLPE